MYSGYETFMAWIQRNLHFSSLLKVEWKHRRRQNENKKK